MSSFQYQIQYADQPLLMEWKDGSYFYRMIELGGVCLSESLENCVSWSKIR